jgi:hypothetical protein
MPSIMTSVCFIRDQDVLMFSLGQVAYYGHGSHGGSLCLNIHTCYRLETMMLDIRDFNHAFPVHVCRGSAEGSSNKGRSTSAFERVSTIDLLKMRAPTGANERWKKPQRLRMVAQWVKNVLEGNNDHILISSRGFDNGDSAHTYNTLN